MARVSPGPAGPGECRPLAGSCCCAEHCVPGNLTHLALELAPREAPRHPRLLTGPWGHLPGGPLQTGRRSRAEPGADADPRGRVGLFEAAATSKLPAAPPFPPPGRALVRRAHPGSLGLSFGGRAPQPPLLPGLVGTPWWGRPHRAPSTLGAPTLPGPRDTLTPAPCSSGAGKEAATGGLEPGARRTARLTLNIDSAASFAHQRQAGGRGRGRRTSLGRRLFTLRKEPLKLN